MHPILNDIRVRLNFEKDSRESKLGKAQEEEEENYWNLAEQENMRTKTNRSNAKPVTCAMFLLEILLYFDVRGKYVVL